MVKEKQTCIASEGSTQLGGCLLMQHEMCGHSPQARKLLSDLVGIFEHRTFRTGHLARIQKILFVLFSFICSVFVYVVVFVLVETEDCENRRPHVIQSL